MNDRTEPNRPNGMPEPVQPEPVEPGPAQPGPVEPGPPEQPGFPPAPPTPPGAAGAEPALEPAPEPESAPQQAAPRTPQPPHSPRPPRRALEENPRPLPSGWPVGSFETYAEAQAAVDMLSDTGSFPVENLTIVGVNLMEVERVVGRLTWGRVIAGGAMSGAWMGIFFGLLLGFFSDNWIAPLIAGLFMGIFFGVISAAVPYAASRGRRDFSSTTQIVAGRYDVLCDPENAREARDAIARFKG